MEKSGFSDFLEPPLSRRAVLLLLIFFLTVVLPSDSDGQSAVQPSSPPLQKETSKDIYFKSDGVISGPPAPRLKQTDYLYFIPLPQLGGNRILIWMMAQTHLYFGAFTLGTLCLVMIFELRGICSRQNETRQKYDRMAHEMLRAVLLALSLTAITGGLFLFGLLAFYPELLRYLATVFRPLLLIYALLFILLSGTTALYEYAWHQMRSGIAKWGHFFIGILINIFGLILLLVANGWSSFMSSPSGVDEAGRFLGNSWNVLHNPLWITSSVHRFFGNIVLGAAVITAYAAVKSLASTSVELRSWYEWMSHVSLLAMIAALCTLPAGGYWMMRATYGYRQQMGITLLGGLLAWVGMLLVILLGGLFIAINYYLWLRTDSTGERRFNKQSKYLLLILGVCFLIYVTPHTLVLTPAELKAMGGAQHPVTGNYGVESSKQPAVNIMIIVTIWSLLSFWRSRSRRSKPRAAEIAFITLFAAGVANIVVLGTYGYFIPANARIGLQIPMVMTTLSIALFGSILSHAMVRKEEKIDRPIWGHLPNRGHYALLFIAVTVTWIMGVGGYRRSAVRLHWHINEILRDSSPWAFTPPLAQVGLVITANVLLFWSALLVLFWLVGLKRNSQSENQKEDKIKLGQEFAEMPE